MNLKPHQSALLSAMVVAAIASLIPFVQVLLLPLVYLNTHIHEFCHAIIGVLTGGSVDEIVVRADGSGVTNIRGGMSPLIGSAGYMGSTIVGALTIYLGSSASRARVVLGSLSAILIVSMAVWVRGDVVGIISGFSLIAIFLLIARYLKGNALLFACQFVGLELCLNSVSSVYQIFKLNVAGEAQGDAAMMQSSTLIPGAFWATLWCLFSLILIGLTVRAVWRSDRKTPQAESR